MAHRLPLAVVDQVAVSGSSLLTGLLVARYETREGFGSFALAYATLLLANSVLMATVIKPFIALEGRRDADAVRDRIGIYLSIQLVVSVAMSATVATAGILAGAGPTFLALAAAIVPVHVLELMRRALLQRFAVLEALGYNILFAAGNVVGLLLLGWLERLTGVTALLVMGASAIVATLAAAGRLGIRPALSGQAIGREAGRAWTFTRWSAPATLMESLEARGYAYLSAAALGLTAPAVLEIGRVMLAPTNVVVFPVGNLSMPAVSHLYARGSLGQVRRVVTQAVLFVGVGVGVYAIATWWFAKPLLGLLYGGRYDDAVSVVRALAVAHVVVCLSGVVGLCLESLGRPRLVFVAQVAGGIVGLGGSWLLFPAVGLAGVAGGMAMGSAVAVFVKAVALRRRLADRDAAPVLCMSMPKP